MRPVSAHVSPRNGSQPTPGRSLGLAFWCFLVWRLASFCSLALSLPLRFSPCLSLGSYLPSWCFDYCPGLLPVPAQVVARLFSSHAPQAAPQRLGKSSSITRLHKAHTVAAKFQQSLLDLIEKMERWVWQVGGTLRPSG